MSDTGFDSLMKSLHKAGNEASQPLKNIARISATNKKGETHSYQVIADLIPIGHRNDTVYSELYALDPALIAQLGKKTPDEAANNPQLYTIIRDGVFGHVSGLVFNNVPMLSLDFQDYNELGIVNSLIDKPHAEVRPVFGLIDEAVQHQLTTQELQKAFDDTSLQIVLDIYDKSEEEARILMTRIFPDRDLTLVTTEKFSGRKNVDWFRYTYK